MDYIINLFQLYAGDGVLMGLYVIAWVVVVCLEKDKENKTAFAFSAWYVPLILLNPLVGMVLEYLQILPERIVRLYWLVPTFFLIAYGVVLLVKKAEKVHLDTAVIFFLVIFLVLAGFYVGENNAFVRTHNLYKLPDEVPKIVDMIRADAQEVYGFNEKEMDMALCKSALPLELATYARQYDGDLPLLFGRYPHGDDSYAAYHLLGVASEIEVDRVLEHAKADGCHYLVLDTSKMWLNMPDEESMIKIGEYANYCLYRLN